MQEKEFFNNLYERALEWRITDGDKPIFRQGLHKIKQWRHEDLWHPFDLEQGMVLRNYRYDCAFALGMENVTSPKRNNKTLVFHFGIWQKFPPTVIDTNNFPRYFNKLYRGSGKFYVEPVLKTPRLDCFADLGEWGGKEVHNWDRENFLTEEGLNECMSLLKVVGHVIMREPYKEES